MKNNLYIETISPLRNYFHFIHEIKKQNFLGSEKNYQDEILAHMKMASQNGLVDLIEINEKINDQFFEIITNDVNCQDAIFGEFIWLINHFSLSNIIRDVDEIRIRIELSNQAKSSFLSFKKNKTKHYSELFQALKNEFKINLQPLKNCDIALQYQKYLYKNKKHINFGDWFYKTFNFTSLKTKFSDLLFDITHNNV